MKSPKRQDVFLVSQPKLKSLDSGHYEKVPVDGKNQLKWVETRPRVYANKFSIVKRIVGNSMEILASGFRPNMEKMRRRVLAEA
jgi:hypothetical protein